MKKLCPHAIMHKNSLPFFPFINKHSSSSSSTTKFLVKLIYQIMVKLGTKLPNLCLNRIRPLARMRSPPPQEKKVDSRGGECKKPEAVSGRRIVIVVDTSVVAKNAVQWALSHTVQNQDLVILLYVAKPSCKENDEREAKSEDGGEKIPKFLTSMKSVCQAKSPNVSVEVEVVEGKEKGAAIVEAARRLEAALLVVGQKKRSVTWRLMMTWAGGRAAAAGVAEYCVQNASCMALAVRKKSKKVGGYLITTKRQKDFWLLA